MLNWLKRLFSGRPMATANPRALDSAFQRAARIVTAVEYSRGGNR